MKNRNTMVLIHFAANFTHSLAVSGLGLGQELPLFSLTAVLTALTVLIIWAAGGLARKATYVKLQPADG